LCKRGLGFVVRFENTLSRDEVADLEEVVDGVLADLMVGGGVGDII
jgi:hypothetical protein